MRHRSLMIRSGRLSRHALARRVLLPDGSLSRPSPADVFCAVKRTSSRQISCWGQVAPLFFARSSAIYASFSPAGATCSATGPTTIRSTLARLKGSRSRVPSPRTEPADRQQVALMKETQDHCLWRMLCCQREAGFIHLREVVSEHLLDATLLLRLLLQCIQVLQE